MPSATWRPLALLLTVTASGCSTDRLSSLGPPEIRATPRALAFTGIAVGGRGRATLSLTNAGRSAVTISFTAPPPFAGPDPVELLPGEQKEVVVSFVPRHAGSFEGELQIDSGAAQLPIPLEGSAVDCEPAEACELALADPEDGTCVRAPASDGTACASACVTDGTCAHGQCAGQSQSCDDADACTLDGCSGTGGCTHSAVRCEEEDDPCTAAACDPTRGCVQVPVADGTACGASTCSLARVCMSGSCVGVPAHEGSVCGIGSPCQDPGTCHLGVCERSSTRALSADWSYAAQPGNLFLSDLAMDADQNLYLVESAQVDDPATLFGRARVPAGWLVSLTSRGRLRYRAPLYAPELLEHLDVSPRDWTPSRLLVDSGVVVLLGTSSIEARAAATGASLWRHEVRRALLAGNERTNAAQSLASDGTHVYAQFGPAPGERYDWLFAFDLATGHELWREGVADSSGLSVDAHGNLVHRYRPSTSYSTAIQTWDRSQLDLIEPGCEPLAGYADRIYASSAGRLSLLTTSSAPQPDGGSACTAPFGEAIGSCFWSMGERLRVGAGPTAYVVDPFDLGCTADGYTYTGFRISGVSDTVQWQLERPTRDITGDDFLTDRHGLLFSELYYGVHGPEGIELVEVDPWGDEVFSCPTDLGSVTLLGDERGYWLSPVRLSSAPIPGVRLAPHGWTAENGGPARTRHVQPAKAR